MSVIPGQYVYQIIGGGGGGGVASVSAGTGISTTGTATDPIVNNTGIISLTATNGISSSGGTTPTIQQTSVGTPGTYAYPASITTDSTGRVSAITGGSAPTAPYAIPIYVNVLDAQPQPSWNFPSPPNNFSNFDVEISTYLQNLFNSTTATGVVQLDFSSFLLTYTTGQDGFLNLYLSAVGHAGSGIQIGIVSGSYPSPSPSQGTLSLGKSQIDMASFRAEFGNNVPTSTQWFIAIENQIGNTIYISGFSQYNPGWYLPSGFP